MSNPRKKTMLKVRELTKKIQESKKNESKHKTTR